MFRDWVGVYLDDLADDDEGWTDVATLVEDAFRSVAPKKLVAELENR